MDAVAVGSLYALIGLGYTMVYGILKFINFSHASIFMYGAWFSLLIARAAGWANGATSPWITVPLTLLTVMIGCAMMGFTIERLAYRPLRNAPRLNVLITAIGVALLLENAGQLKWIFGPQPERMPSLLPDRILATVMGVHIRLVDVFVIGLTLGIMAAIQWLVFRTRLGRAMRATSYNHQVAALMGINVDRVISTTFIIGSALAGAAGFFYAMKYPGLNQPAHSTWVLLGLKAFVAAVVGGIGNIQGAVLGGLLIGGIELFGAAYFSPHLRDIYVFSLLILVLLVRPSGLLGSADVEKL